MNMQLTATNGIPSSFGHGAVHLRAKGSAPLSLDEIAKYCPSVMAEQAHSSRSDR